jgi:transcriptional regulator with XRE-family HTH domain
MTKPRLLWRKFGRDLRLERKSLGFSIRKMAQEIKINHSTYVRAERGKTIEAAHFVRVCYWTGFNPWIYLP